MPLFQALKPGARIYDIGAGPKPTLAIECVRRGVAVTAIDKHHDRPEDASPLLQWYMEGVEEHVRKTVPPAQDAFAILLVLPFLDSKFVRDELAEFVTRHSNPGAVVAVSAFTRDPEPAFLRPISIWTTDTLADAFPAFKPELHDTYSFRGPGLNGQERNFHVCEFVGRKQ